MCERRPETVNAFAFACEQAEDELYSRRVLSVRHRSASGRVVGVSFGFGLVRLAAITRRIRGHFPTRRATTFCIAQFVVHLRGMHLLNINYRRIPSASNPPFGKHFIRRNDVVLDRPGDLLFQRKATAMSPAFVGRHAAASAIATGISLGTILGGPVCGDGNADSGQAHKRCRDGSGDCNPSAAKIKLFSKPPAHECLLLPCGSLPIVGDYRREVSSWSAIPSTQRITNCHSGHPSNAALEQRDGKVNFGLPRLFPWARLFTWSMP